MASSSQISGPALVVEDDAILAMAMAQTLAELGLDPVHTCASAREAMASLRTLRPAVLTLDVALADRKDGWALAELARQVSTCPPVIIFATGSPQSVPPHIARLGHVVAKPVDPADIRAVLQDAQRRRGLLAGVRRLWNDRGPGRKSPVPTRFYPGIR